MYDWCVTTRTIDLKELLDRGADLVHDVESGVADFVITVDGKPVAALRPLRESPAPVQPREAEEWLARWHLLIRRIAEPTAANGQDRANQVVKDRESRARSLDGGR